MIPRSHARDVRRPRRATTDLAKLANDPRWWQRLEDAPEEQFTDEQRETTASIGEEGEEVGWL